MIDTSPTGKGKIYVDANMVANNNIPMETLLQWYDQPWKYNFSNNLRNKILREKKRLVDLEIQGRHQFKTD